LRIIQNKTSTRNELPAICLAYTVVMRRNQGVSIPDSANPGYKVF
jgi:hypothetical protein